jgi:hypothetical protein
VKLVFISIQDFAGPCNEIGCTLAARLGSHPELEVFGTVISADSIEVMDVFVPSKRAPETFGHHEAMHHDRPGWTCVRMARSADELVAVMVSPNTSRLAPNEWITVAHEAPVVSLAKAARLSRRSAVLCCAGPHGMGDVQRIAPAPPPTIVALAIAAAVSRALALLHGTLRLRARCVAYA